MEEHRLRGGRDLGAWRVGSTVRRPWRPWSASVQHLLTHLADVGFDGSPRPYGRDADGREVLEHLHGDTVGDERPWPAWAHADESLPYVGHWLRRYHSAVADYVPPPGARWRGGISWTPGMLIAHNDAAPYNAVWNDDALTGFIDWDDAGPSTRDDDLAWTVFSWAPLHARHVAASEGFCDFGHRRDRVAMILRGYGFEGATQDVIGVVDERIARQVDIMRSAASAGDPSYQAMLARGQDRDLLVARDELGRL